MMQERTTTFWGCMLLLFLLALCVGLGYASRNVWVGGEVFAGIFCVLAGSGLYLGSRQRGSYLALALTGFFLLGFAVWTSKMAGRWLWTPVWLSAALFPAVVGMENAQRGETGWQIASYALAAAAGLFSVLGPSVFYGRLNGTSEVIVAGQIWVWLLFGAGAVSLAAAWWQGYLKEEGRLYLLFAGLGIASFGGASWLVRAEAGWWLTLPWLAAGGVIVYGAKDLRQWESGLKTTGDILAGLCLLIAIGAPVLLGGLPARDSGGSTSVDPAAATLSAEQLAATQLAEAVQTATAAAVVQVPAGPSGDGAAGGPSEASAEGLSAAGGFRALWSFLVTAGKSVWGIFHLLVLFMIGQLWVRRWGGPAVLLLLVALAWYGGYAPEANPGLQETLEHAVSSSPAGWMRDLAGLSNDRFGTPGWGLVIAGAVVPLVLLPAMRMTARTNRAIADDPSIQERIGSGLSYETMRRIGIDPLQSMVASVTVMAVSVGLPIALWIGLRQAADAADGVFLGFLQIPDLSVPNFRPVWQAGYFYLAAVLAGNQALLSLLQKRLRLVQPGMAACVNPFLVGFGALLAGLFVPAGVLLFQASQSLAQSALLPLITTGLEPARKPPPLRPEPRPTPPTPALKPTIDSTPPPPTPPAAPDLSSSLIYRLDPAVVSLAVNEDDDVWMLHTDGLLTLIREMKARGFRLETEAAFGVVPLKGSEILVIEGSGCLSRLRLDEGMTLAAQMRTGIPIGAYALNPFRTMLAYLSPEHRQVRGMFIETRKETEFLADLDLSPALAFNPGGRELAVGTPSGGVTVLDIATRKIAYQLDHAWLITGPSTPSPIAFLLAYSELEWLVMYEDNRMVKWSTEGKALRSIALPSTPTCVEIGPNGEIAVGSRSGYVRIYDADFEETFKDKVQRAKVVQLAFAENGRSLYSIGNDDELRRTRL